MSSRDPKKVNLTQLNDTQREYRATLIQLEQRSQEAADKTVISLAGGALGVSFAFIKQFVGDDAARAIAQLGVAWTLWVLSLTFVLVSHYVSALAARDTLDQYDKSKEAPRAGSGYDRALKILNPAALTAFIAGLGFAGYFVIKNL